MIFKSIYIGNSEEAYIFEDFHESLNIISSDDNNKGKTIVIQGLMYCLGNTPAFPASFPYQDYYYILHVVVDGRLIKICRKDKNYVINLNDEYFIFDTTAEFKRYWTKNIKKLPIILKDRVQKIVDPELLVQTFFVGQDKKTTNDIINKGLYRKEDFYKLLFAMNGINTITDPTDDVEKVKKKIKELSNEKERLLKENKILKSNNSALEYLSATNDRIALANSLKELDRIKEKLLKLKKERNNAVSRRAKNEMALKELRSLNRTMKTGEIACMDCGSNHIAYESADSDFSFDISTASMRKQILDSVQEKIDIYNEEIERLTYEINLCQKEFDTCMSNADIPLEALLIMTRELKDAKEVDARLGEIETEIKNLKVQLETKNEISDAVHKKQIKLMEDIVAEMNCFYRYVDVQGKDEYVDIFTSKGKTYSGSEATEFHMSKMYAFYKVLQHNYPIVIDSFRAEDLSAEREKRALELFKGIKNQIILTTTLKEEEGNKYANMKGINNIDFSNHITNQMLTSADVGKFLVAAEDMMITI